MLYNFIFCFIHKGNPLLFCSSVRSLRHCTSFSLKYTKNSRLTSLKSQSAISNKITYYVFFQLENKQPQEHLWCNLQPAEKKCSLLPRQQILRSRFASYKINRHHMSDTLFATRKGKNKILTLYQLLKFDKYPFKWSGESIGPLQSVDMLNVQFKFSKK